MEVIDDPALVIMKKYPRLTAHLICESLGYFSPRCAASAIYAHVNKKPYFCEWYESLFRGTITEEEKQTLRELDEESSALCAAGQYAKQEETMRKSREIISLVNQRINQKVIRNTFRHRRSHRGYMADYCQAKAIVQMYVEKQKQPHGGLASWF